MICVILNNSLMECFCCIQAADKPIAADTNKHETAMSEGNTFNRVNLFKLCICKYKYNNKITCKE